MEMYSEAILRYYEMPPNKHKLESANRVSRKDNPLCGDEITVFLKVNSKGVIEKASFEGQGCAVSQASVSMLLETIEGKKLSDARKITEEKVLEMLGGKISPARLKCAFLGLNALKESVNHRE